MTGADALMWAAAFFIAVLALLFAAILVDAFVDAFLDWRRDRRRGPAQVRGRS